MAKLKMIKLPKAPKAGSEEVVRENFGVPLEGDRDVGALCGSHQG